ANPERLQRCRCVGAGVRGHECRDEQAQGENRFHAANPPGELPLLTADEERNSNRESRAEARQERENSNPRVSFKETPGANSPGVFVAFTDYAVSSIGASGTAAAAGQTEREQRAALRDRIESRGLRHRGCTDGAELVVQIQARRYRH